MFPALLISGETAGQSNEDDSPEAMFGGQYGEKSSRLEYREYYHMVEQ